MWTKWCPLGVFWPQCLKVAKLGVVDAPGEWLFPVGFRVGGQGRTADLCANVCSMPFDPFAWKLSNLVPWMPIASKWLLMMFRSHDLRRMSNCWSLYKYCPLGVIWPLWLRVARLVAVDVPREKNFLIDFQVTWSKVKVKLVVCIQNVIR